MNKTDAAEETVLQISSLEKSFDNNTVLQGLDLKLRKGENLVVMGKSGTGKSVLIKCIVGLIEPDDGNIDVFGEDVLKANRKELNNIRKRMGFLFQGAALYDSMSVGENLLFPLKRLNRDMKKSDLMKQAEKVLNDVGLPEVMNQMPSELSGGMRKRIGLARTIITKPEILLYDEPTTGLDPVTSNEISLLINKIREKYNTSSIIITHDLACARTTADRIVMLRDGKIYAEGTYAELSDSEDEWVQSFFINQ
jgi:phospholipid/cholesterol/gamma-HCH transport system ATP-binding protein